jgi:hypothetical protein
MYIAAAIQPGTAHLPFDVKVTVVSNNKYSQGEKKQDPPDAPPKSEEASGSDKQELATASAAEQAQPHGTATKDHKDDSKSNKADGGDKDQTQTEPPAGVMSCKGTANTPPCTTTRTFTSKDREWWDVSIGVTIPGVREPKYSIVNSALHRSVTLHTDFYAMLDLYPFAYFAANDDWEPHFNLGVPITGQSLYRPYFGMAESVGGLLTRVFRPQRQINLPLGLNVFAGMTWMKTQIVRGNPTTTGDLTLDSQSTHVWKAVYGVEVPISSLASKIKGVTSKNTNGSGKSTSSSGGGT